MQLLKAESFPSKLFYTTHDGLQCSSLPPTPVVILPIYTYATFHPVLSLLIRSHHSDKDNPRGSELPAFGS